jgi:hypothetical protein
MTNNETLKSLFNKMTIDMPHWKIAGSIHTRKELNTHSVEYLRHKFLGDELTDKAYVVVLTFKVEPNTGGMQKVAEFRNGKIQIISG